MSGPSTEVRAIGGFEWPARCGDCGLVTEDPDAYHGTDEEAMPEGRLCPATGTFHEWVAVVRPKNADEYVKAMDEVRKAERERLLADLTTGVEGLPGWDWNDPDNVSRAAVLDLIEQARKGEQG